jgi:hypothetical protein
LALHNNKGSSPLDQGHLDHDWASTQHETIATFIGWEQAKEMAGELRRGQAALIKLVRPCFELAKQISNRRTVAVGARPINARDEVREHVAVQSRSKRTSNDIKHVIALNALDR